VVSETSCLGVLNKATSITLSSEITLYVGLAPVAKPSVGLARQLGIRVLFYKNNEFMCSAKISAATVLLYLRE
jgi:hypothetical protein